MNITKATIRIIIPAISKVFQPEFITYSLGLFGLYLTVIVLLKPERSLNKLGEPLYVVPSTVYSYKPLHNSAPSSSY